MRYIWKVRIQRACHRPNKNGPREVKKRYYTDEICVRRTKLGRDEYQRC